MKVVRTCPYLGTVNSMEIAVTNMAITEWYLSGTDIHHHFPHLTEGECEFIRSGDRQVADGEAMYE